MGVDHSGRQWRANFGLTYSHGRFTHFPSAAIYDLVDGRLQATAQDLGGYPLPQGPDFTATGSVTRYFGLGRGWAGSFTASARFSSAYDFTAGAGGELGASRQPAFALVNLRAAVTSPEEFWALEGFVSNLFSQRYISLISTGNTGVYMTPADPRTYGVTLRRTF